MAYEKNNKNIEPDSNSCRCSNTYYFNCTSSNSINVDQRINSVESNETIVTNNIDNGEYEIVGDIINANDVDCFAEDDKTRTANEWMGITSGFVKFTILDEGATFGTVSVSGPDSAEIASTYFKIPNYITYKGKRYDVTTIGERAFVACLHNLAGVLTIPASVTSIGEMAFTECIKLTSLDLSNAIGLVSLGGAVFRFCSGLTSVTIPASVTSIGGEDFSECPNLNVCSFLSENPPTFQFENMFELNGTANSKIMITVPKGARAKWVATPDIQINLGIANLNQIKEPVTPPIGIEKITIDKEEGPYIFDTTLTGQTNVVKASSAILLAEASQNIDWAITTKGETTKPSNISIDQNGQVTIDSTSGMQPIKYDLTIKATCPTDEGISTSPYALEQWTKWLFKLLDQ